MGRDVGGLASELLRLPVRAMGIRLGRPVDFLFDASTLRAVALEVACGDGTVRLLPIAAARVRDDHIALDSPFLLIDHDGERSFYRSRTRPLAALREAEVVRAGRALGRLADVELAADGVVTAAIVDDGARVPLDGDVELLADAPASAA
jgi:hypothetical protein